MDLNSTVQVTRRSIMWQLFAILLGIFLISSQSLNAAQDVRSADQNSAINLAGWNLVDDFSGLSHGSLNGRNGWTATSQVMVEADPVAGSGKVMALSGSEEYSFKAFANTIPENGQGTIFFRMRQIGSLNGFAGGSDASNPSNWSDFEVQVGAQPATGGKLLVRDGGSILGGTTSLYEEVWHCIWLEVDNNTDTYQVYVRGGAYDTRVPVLIDDNSSFDFRNGTTQSIQTFFSRTGSSSGGMYIDDIYIDSSSFNSTVAAGHCEQNDNLQPPSEGGWKVVDNFDGVSAGSLNGKNGWTATSGAQVVSDPENGSGKVIALTGNDQHSSKLFPQEIRNPYNGTLFFRMRRTGSVDGFGGASDLKIPNSWESFETQVGGQPSDPNKFRVRSASSYLGNSQVFQDETWYCVWVEMDNQTNKYNLFAQGGQFGGRTALSAGGKTTFDFRNGASSALRSFFGKTGQAGGTLYFDDIYIDADNNNSGKPGGDCPLAEPPQENTPTPVPSNTPTSTPTATATAIATATKVPTLTQTPPPLPAESTATATNIPTASPTAEPTQPPAATVTPTQTSSPTPIIDVTEQPSQTPTVLPPTLTPTQPAGETPSVTPTPTEQPANPLSLPIKIYFPVAILDN